VSNINQAIKILKAGGVVVYPTDTAYGLAVDATNEKAVDKLYKLKGRDFNKPVHVIFPDTSWLKKIVKLNRPAVLLMNKFLPGPLTIVLPLLAKGKSWQKLSAKTKTMGVRMPNHKLAMELVLGLGKPITTTSANVSGMPICYSIAEVKKQFKSQPKKPDFYINAGKLPKTSPSTVVSLVKGVKIIRQGPISETQIREVVRGKK
jgi:L-threonylcarbamoyladenylate synthase